MRSRQLGMSPAKIAIAVAVTIEAMAGTGSMKNVTGTSSAVAMVAVSPGTAPTNRPNAAEAKITPSTYGSNTSRRASKSILLEHAPWQRNAQQLVEREVDRHGRDHPDHSGDAPRAAKDAEPGDHQRDAGEVESQPIGSDDVEQQASHHAGHAEQRTAAVHPVGECKPRSTLAHARDDEQHTAETEPGGDHPREPCRAELLARHGREPLDVPEDQRGERGERRAGQRIVDLYLASPTAFRAAPRFLSDSARS